MAFVTHTSELLNRSWPKLMRLKSVAGCYLEIFCARHLTRPPVAENHPFSSRRRARTTSQRHKRTSPSHRPTSSTITFLIIKRTNAEANTIILPLQKKRRKKTEKSPEKSIPTEKSSSFLQDKSFMILYCKCHVINVMCWV